MSPTSRKASSKLVKSMNRKLIIDELKRNPRQSRADIAKKTKLSRPCVSELVKELIEERLVVEVGIGTSTGGKRPILLEYNAKSNFVIGSVIEGNSLSIILADMNGDWVDTTIEYFQIPTNGYYIINLIEKSVKTLLKQQQVCEEDILGMVIGISGISLESDKKFGFSPEVDWSDIHLKEEIESRLGFPVIVDNDVNVMTIGEFYKGDEKYIKNLVYLFVGNGIGSGIVVDGKFYKGFHSAAGEIGYMMIGNQIVTKPNMGVFETNYGLLGIRKKLENEGFKLPDYQSPIQFLQENELTSEKAKQLLEEVLYHWAVAIINLSSVLDPQLVIIAGEMEKLNQKSLSYLVSIVNKYLPKSPKIKITSLGSKAGLYGAVHLALDNYSHNQVSF